MPRCGLPGPLWEWRGGGSDTIRSRRGCWHCTHRPDGLPWAAEGAEPQGHIGIPTRSGTELPRRPTAHGGGGKAGKKQDQRVLLGNGVGAGHCGHGWTLRDVAGPGCDHQ